MILEMKVLVDIGFVGFLNVGKSMLFFVIFVVKFEIGDYLFMILCLNFGIV